MAKKTAAEIQAAAKQKANMFRANAKDKFAAMQQKVKNAKNKGK